METYDGSRTGPIGTRLRAVRADERGFTLVEMMVAIVLLAIILTALMTVIISSLTAMQLDEQQVRATHLAQEELERLRAIEWDCVGFDATDPDYVGTYNGNPTVTLDAAECSDTTIAPDPSPRVRPVDGIDYTVTPHVYWIDDPEDDPAAGPDPDPQDYKEFAVDVNWTVRGQTYTYSNTTTRVPTVEEVPITALPVAAAFEITSYQVDPTIVQIDDDGDTLQAITVTVETSSAASLVQLVVAPPATYGTATLTDISAGAGTRWQLVIPDEEDEFPAGDHTFTVNATGGAASDTESQTVTFAEITGSPVVVKTPALAPSAPICVKNGNRRSFFAVVVTVDVDGLSVSDEVTVSWTDDTGSVLAVPLAPTAGGARFSGTIPSNTRFNGATTTLTVAGRRVSDNSVAQGTYTVGTNVTNSSSSC